MGLADITADFLFFLECLKNCVAVLRQRTSNFDIFVDIFVP